MNAAVVMILLLLVFVPLAVFIGFALWAQWLWKRTPGSRWMVLPAAVLPLVAQVVGLAFGFQLAVGVFGGEGVDPSQTARILAEGISEAMNYMAVGVLFAIFAAAWMLGLTWRYRRARRSKETRG